MTAGAALRFAGAFFFVFFAEAFAFAGALFFFFFGGAFFFAMGPRPSRTQARAATGRCPRGPRPAKRGHEPSPPAAAAPPPGHRAGPVRRGRRLVARLGRGRPRARRGRDAPDRRER